MLDNLDGALMVMSDPREGEFLIVWKGGSTLRRFDCCLDEVDVRTCESIADAVEARALAELWADDIYESEYDDYEYEGEPGSWSDAEALRSAGWGTDEDYGG